jgi:ribosomal protein S17E
MKIATIIKRKSRKIAEKYGSFFAVFPENIDNLPNCEIVLLNDKKQYIDSITQSELKAL